MAARVAGRDRAGGADDGCRRSRGGLRVEGHLAAAVACYDRVRADHEAICAFYAGELDPPGPGAATLWRRGDRVSALAFNDDRGTADGETAYYPYFFIRPVSVDERPVP